MNEKERLNIAEKNFEKACKHFKIALAAFVIVTLANVVLMVYRHIHHK